MEKISISLTEKHAAAIRARVESGEYASASEVIRAALRVLEEDEQRYQEQLEAIRKRVRASLDDPRPSLSMEEVDAHLEELFERARKLYPEFDR